MENYRIPISESQAISLQKAKDLHFNIELSSGTMYRFVPTNNIPCQIIIRL